MNVMYNNYWKRFFDLFIALILTVVTIPLHIVIILLIWMADGKEGVFFRQVRVGKDEKLFVLYKYRTMRTIKGEDGKLLSDLKRLSSIGRFLRSLSLDELPQLYNVLKGDMSLIGPRPLLERYLSLYSEEQKRRHQVRPGITGWAQVNGRNAISWQKKFELDVWYVDHCSWLLDLKIVGLTLIKVLSRDGVAKEGHATTVPFDGKN